MEKEEEMEEGEEEKDLANQNEGGKVKIGVGRRGLGEEEGLTIE